MNVSKVLRLKRTLPGLRLLILRVEDLAIAVLDSLIHLFVRGSILEFIKTMLLHADKQNWNYCGFDEKLLAHTTAPVFFLADSIRQEKHTKSNPLHQETKSKFYIMTLLYFHHMVADLLVCFFVQELHCTVSS